MATSNTDFANRVCVTGANGFLASLLVKRLLEMGFFVNATVRDPGNEEKVSHLVNIPGAEERLKLFKADLSVEGSFDDAVLGCQGVFHVATPVNFFPEDPEADVIIPAVKGVLNVLESCSKSNTVKKVVMTSSEAAYLLNACDDTYKVIDESCWTDVDYLRRTKPFAWPYPVSKVMAEKEALKYAEEKGIALVTLAPAMMLGRGMTKEAWSSSIALGASLLTGNTGAMETLKNMQRVSKCVAVVDVEDSVSAHIHLYQHPSAQRRYLCCPITTTVPKIAKFLSVRYPQYPVAVDTGSEPLPFDEKVKLCSDKLLETGFSFSFPSLEDIYDHTIDYLQEFGLLNERN